MPRGVRGTAKGKASGKPPGQDIRSFFSRRPVNDGVGQDDPAAPETPAPANPPRSATALNASSSLITPVTAEPSSLARPLTTPRPLPGPSFVKPTPSLLATPVGPEEGCDADRPRDAGESCVHVDDDVDDDGGAYRKVNRLRDDLIDDDEYIGEDAFEDLDDDFFDEEDEDDEEAAEASSHPGQKRSLGTAQGPSQPKRARSDGQELKEWFERIEAKYPTTEQDEQDITRFKTKFGALVNRLCTWARGDDANPEEVDAWYDLPKECRALTQGFRNFLGRAEPQKLLQEIFDHMPTRSQAVLGRADLKPIDLAELPVVTEDFREKLTYLNVPTRLDEADVIYAPYKVKGRRRRLRHGASLQSSKETRVYVGSSNAKQGGGYRITQHNLASDAGHHGKLYAFASQKGVLNNFRVLGAWYNVLLPGRQQACSQDTERVLPVLLEGLMVAFLNLCDRKHVVVCEYAPEPTFELISRVRKGLDLPDFAAQSLNSAWPLYQGVAGGFQKVAQCAWCGRWRDPSAAVPGDPSGVIKWSCQDEPWGPRICLCCHRHRLLNDGAKRTREGAANGTYPHEIRDIHRINTCWFDVQRTKPKCQNEACSVELVEGCTIFGMENSARCKRCHDFRRISHKEWAGDEPSATPVPSRSCSSCEKEGLTEIRIWKGQSVCEACYANWCCYGTADKPGDYRSHTKAACGNPACPMPEWAIKSGKVIRQTQDKTWLCLPCDWSRYVLGKELTLDAIDEVEDSFKTQAKPPSPIPHHEHNATSCCICGQFATFWQWTELGASTFLCSMCSESDRCKNAECDSSPLTTVMTLRPSGLCHKCDGYTNDPKTKGQSRPKAAKVAPPAGTDPSAPRCGNPGCDTWWNPRTQACKPSLKDKFFHHHLGDPALLRCKRCYEYRKNHGGQEFSPETVRLNQKTVNAARKSALPGCGNINCSRTPANFTAGWRGKGPNRRCISCYSYSLGHNGEERPLRLTSVKTKHDI